MRIVRAVLRLTFPEVEPGIDDETIGDAAERWPTHRHDKWKSVFALLRAMGLSASESAMRKV